MSTGIFDTLGLQGVTQPSTNVSSGATVGFEVKDGRDTCFIQVTESTFNTDFYVSLCLGMESVGVTAAQAKTLPGVTAGEVINLYAECFADSLENSRAASVQMRFFNESGVQQGDMVEVSATEATVWQGLGQAFLVPTGATRVNFYLHVTCNDGDTMEAWFAHVKIKR